jgi:hypothetical protein
MVLSDHVVARKGEHCQRERVDAMWPLTSGIEKRLT